MTNRLRAVARRGRGPVLGLASQLLNAGTNVVTAYLASLLLTPEDFGRFVVAFAAVTIVLGAGRGLIGSTMMVHLPAQDDADRAVLVRSATGFTTLVGLAAAVVLSLAGLVTPVLWLFVPWVAVALLHDVGRYVFLSGGENGRALALDVTWAVVQATALGLGALVGTVTLGLVSCAWGLGALGGLVLAGAMLRVLPTHPRRWARATRDVAGWFTGVAVVGQVEVYAVLLLTGALLSVADVGGVRAVQLLTYQPPIVLLAALITLVQPSMVRARGSAPALRAAWRRTTVAVAPVLGFLGLVTLLRGPLMGLLFPQYVASAPLVVPMAVQSTFVALSVGPLAVLNGLRQGSSAFRSQLMRSAGVALAAAVGVWVDGSTGLVWALAVASALAWTQLCLAASRAIARSTSATAGASARPFQVGSTGDDLTPSSDHLDVR